MRKLTAYYLILLYAACTAKPVTIWFADIVAHVYFGHQHAAVVHGEDGHDHVHHQINKATKEDLPEQKTTTPKNNEEVTVASFVETISREERLVPAMQAEQNATLLPSVFLSVPLPPPWRLFS